MRSYSVAALVLTLKPRQTNKQCYRVIQLRSVSIQQEGLKSDIGEFSHLIDRHGVCGNNNKVSVVTNLLVESVFGQKNAVFHVFGCFKFKVTFRFEMVSWNIKTEKKSTISFGNRTC